MIEIYHVSDLHIGRDTEKAQLLLESLKQNFEIGEHEDRYLLVTGDIVQHGWKGQYNTALRALEPFKDKIWVAPGNHDYGFMGFMYSQKSAMRFDDPFAADLEHVHNYFLKAPYSKLIQDTDGNKVLLIGLNSCSKTKAIWDIAKGEIGADQRNELERILSLPANRDIPKIVFLHHIPHRRAHGIGMSLKDHEELMGIIRGRVDALTFGHEGSMSHIDTKVKKRAKLSDSEYKNLADVRDSGLPMRSMKLRSGRGQDIKYYLDANHSVKDQACYRISVEGNEVKARFIRLA